MEGTQEGRRNNLLIRWQGKFKMEKSLYHSPIPITTPYLNSDVAVVGRMQGFV